jgi:ECF transporter S component (folate family)
MSQICVSATNKPQNNACIFLKYMIKFGCSVKSRVARAAVFRLSAGRTGSCRSDEAMRCVIRIPLNCFHWAFAFLLPLSVEIFQTRRFFIMLKQENQAQKSPIAKYFLIKPSVLNLCMLAVLLALHLVMARFLSVNVGVNMKFNFSFVSIALAGYMFGVTGGVFVAGAGDIIGALLFPTGPFYLGFTVTAIIRGMAYGFALKGKYSQVKTLAIITPVSSFCTLILNSFWLQRLYPLSTKFPDYFAWFYSRVPETIIYAVGIPLVLHFVLGNKVFEKAMSKAYSH